MWQVAAGQTATASAVTASDAAAAYPVHVPFRSKPAQLTEEGHSGVLLLSAELVGSSGFTASCRSAGKSLQSAIEDNSKW